MAFIEIEIGIKVEKERWKSEIKAILQALGIDNIKKLGIKKIIVASNFEETVSRLKGLKNYKSKRYAIDAQAKVICKSIEENYIIISGNFWKTFNNYKIKFIFLSHEIYHIRNSLYLPQPINYHNSKSTYLTEIYELYNEYSATRFSISFLEYQEIKDVIKILYDGFMSELQNPETFYLPMRKVIEDFRYFRIDINEYLINISKYIEPILKYVSSIFAYCHCCPEIKKEFDNVKTKIFVNEEIIKLFDIFSSWYENKRNIIYEDCLEYMENFLKILGIKYSDVEEGIYATVTDI